LIREEDIVLHQARDSDLDFILATEQQQENKQFIIPWPREKHEEALKKKDFLYLIVEEQNQKMPVGYVILAGLENPNKSIELMRIVITKKGQGIGEKVLRLTQHLAFEELQAHRLWLDVKEHNMRARYLYQKVGFSEEGKLRDCLKTETNYESLIIMSILLNEFQQEI